MERVFYDHKPLHGVLALVKFAFLALVIFLTLRYSGVNPIAFVVGISVVLLGLIWETVREGLRAGRQGRV